MVYGAVEGVSAKRVCDEEEYTMLDAIRSRRSIRHFEQRPVPDEIVEQLKEAMLRSPTGRSLHPWRFVFVRDPELLRALSQTRQRASAFVAEAPLAVVVCGEPATSDTWVEDCAIAAVTLQLAAVELGLGSCWTQIRLREHPDGRSAEEYVREVLGLAPDVGVLCTVALGYPSESKPERERDSLAWAKIEDR
jgi:nitroreductase